MTRHRLLARIAKLERPRQSRNALRRELERLEQQHPLIEPDFSAMTDDQLDDFFRENRNERSPWRRIVELRELLRTPKERAEDERRRARFDAMSDEELDAWLEGYRERCRTGG